MTPLKKGPLFKADEQNIDFQKYNFLVNYIFFVSSQSQNINGNYILAVYGCCDDIHSKSTEKV